MVSFKVNLDDCTQRIGARRTKLGSDSMFLIGDRKDLNMLKLRPNAEVWRHKHELKSIWFSCQFLADTYSQETLLSLIYIGEYLRTVTKPFENVYWNWLTGLHFLGQNSSLILSQLNLNFPKIGRLSSLSINGLIKHEIKVNWSDTIFVNRNN